MIQWFRGYRVQLGVVVLHGGMRSYWGHHIVVMGWVLVALLLTACFPAYDENTVPPWYQTETAAAPTPIVPTPLPPTERPPRPVRGSDSYPVLLEIQPAGASSRGYVVWQLPSGELSWAYDDRNPDVASWLPGSLLKPVLGIPFGPDNAASLQALTPGDKLLLHMSTGNILTYDVETIERVTPQDTSPFEQDEVGIALAMLGETDAPDRLVVTGSYLADQELVETGTVEPVEVVQQGTPVLLSNDMGTLNVLETYVFNGDESSQLADDLAYLFVDLEVAAPEEQPLNLRDLNFNLLDGDGQRYSTVDINHSIVNYVPAAGQVIEAEERLKVSIAFLVPRNLNTGARLLVSTASNEPPTAVILRFVPPSFQFPSTTITDYQTTRPANTNIWVLVSYDANQNDIADITEGIPRVSVRVLSARSNILLSSGITAPDGSVRMETSLQDNEEVLIVIPILSMGREFNPGTSGTWSILLPAVTMPAIIP